MKLICLHKHDLRPNSSLIPPAAALPTRRRSDAGAPEFDRTARRTAPGATPAPPDKNYAKSRRIDGVEAGKFISCKSAEIQKAAYSEGRSRQLADNNCCKSLMNSNLCDINLDNHKMIIEKKSQLCFDLSLFIYGVHSP